MDSFPPPREKYVSLDILVNSPRTPEHCIWWARLWQWYKVNYQHQGDQDLLRHVEFDRNNPEHIQWIYETALERATQLNIQGVTYQLTEGVLKRITPSVAPINAVIAGESVESPN